MPVALLLNEAQTYEECLGGMEAGFNMVMLDTSTWQLWPAMEQTRELVRVAHEQGVAVEAELGYLPDATEQSIDATLAALTDPEEAALFVDGRCRLPGCLDWQRPSADEWLRLYRYRPSQSDL